MELNRLKDMLWQALDESTRNGEITSRDLDTVHKLTDTIKNIYKIECLEDEGGYSSKPYMHADTYMHDDSYGRHWVRGHYSRGTDAFADEIRRFMDDKNLSSSDKQALSRAMDILGR